MQLKSHSDFNCTRLEEVLEIFTDAPFRWWVSGGHALEFHLGRCWRAHDDIDIGILRVDGSEVHAWLDGWELWIAVDGDLRPWLGEALDAETGENNVWVRAQGASSWIFDMAINSGDAEGWVYRRDQRILRSWETTILKTANGIPYLAPEIQLLFKAKDPRPKDHRDAAEVIPELSAKQRWFLREHLGVGHPWAQMCEECWSFRRKLP